MIQNSDCICLDARLVPRVTDLGRTSPPKFQPLRSMPPSGAWKSVKFNRVIKSCANRGYDKRAGRGGIIGDEVSTESDSDRVAASCKGSRSEGLLPGRYGLRY